MMQCEAEFAHSLRWTAKQEGTNTEDRVEV